MSKTPSDDFPDNNHAIKLNELEQLISHLEKINVAIGSGLKTQKENLIKKQQ